MSQVAEVQWTRESMVEVKISQPDDFLKVRETLSRIGVASRKEKNFTSLVIFCTSKVSIILFILRNCLH